MDGDAGYSSVFMDVCLRVKYHHCNRIVVGSVEQTLVGGMIVLHPDCLFQGLLAEGILAECCAKHSLTLNNTSLSYNFPQKIPFLEFNFLPNLPGLPNLVA